MKIRNIYILLVLVCSLIVSSCVLKEKSPVGVMCAINEEVTAILHLMQITKQAQVNGKSFYFGKIGAQSVIVVTSGVGKVNAASMAQILISEYGVKKLIFTGVAGAISNESKLGDIIIAEKSAHHDFYMIKDDKKIHRKSGERFFTPAKYDSVWYDLTKTNLFMTLQNIVNDIELKKIPESLPKDSIYPKVKFGRVITGDQFIASSAMKKELYDRFRADAVEMEGAAVIQVCENNNIECILIRTICDNANENAKIDYKKFVEYSSQNAAIITAELIKNII